jgi:hypothetical protein
MSHPFYQRISPPAIIVYHYTATTCMHFEVHQVENKDKNVDGGHARRTVFGYIVTHLSYEKRSTTMHGTRGYSKKHDVDSFGYMSSLLSCLAMRNFNRTIEPATGVLSLTLNKPSMHHKQEPGITATSAVTLCLATRWSKIKERLVQWLVSITSSALCRSFGKAHMIERSRSN